MFSILWVIPEPIWNKLTIRFLNNFNDNYRANHGNFKEFQSKILLIYLKFSILPDGPDIIQIHVTFWQTTYVSAITLNFSWRTIIRFHINISKKGGYKCIREKVTLLKILFLCWIRNLSKIWSAWLYFDWFYRWTSILATLWGNFQSFPHIFTLVTVSGTHGKTCNWIFWKTLDLK